MARFVAGGLASLRIRVLELSEEPVSPVRKRVGPGRKAGAGAGRSVSSRFCEGHRYKQLMGDRGFPDSLFGRSPVNVSSVWRQSPV